MKTLITSLLVVFAVSSSLSQSAPALRIDEDGRVGIGTSSPSATLHIKGSGIAFEPVDGQSTPTVNFQGLNPTARFQFQNYISTTLSHSYFSFFGDDQTNPSRAGELKFAGSYLRFYSDVTSGDPNPFGIENMRLTTDGKLGVGFTSVGTSYKMAVNGSILADAFITASDRRLKNNIKEFKYGLSEIMKINPYTFEYNGKVFENDGIKFGILAQDFEKIIPEAVSDFKYEKHNLENEVVEKGTYKAVNTSAIQYALVNAIKEQQELIEELNLANEELQNKIYKISNKLDSLQINVMNVSIGIPKEESYLTQNFPNPFTKLTTFEYFVQEDSYSALLYVTNISGQIIKSIELPEKGRGLINIHVSGLPSGIYFCTLEVDGMNIDTKKITLLR